MWWRLPLTYLAVGLALLYVGERALTDASRWAIDALGVALVLLASALALWRAVRASDTRRRAAWRIFVEYVLVLLGLGIYVLQLRELGIARTGELGTILRVGWPALVLLGLFPAIAKEVALARMARNPTIEAWRLRLAGRAARILVLGLITFAGVNYAASRWNRTLDLSYFKTTAPGSSTEALVRGLTRPIELLLFFPPGNEVLEQVRAYADTLARAGSLLQVHVLDQALDPERARALQIRSNGYLALKSESMSDTLHIGLDMEQAQRTLRTLDAKVQRSLIKVARPPRVAYLTSGHDERETSATPGDTRLGYGDFRKLLESLGFTIKRLGLGEGLGRAVPDDATLVAVPGPVSALLAEEDKVLAPYLQQGGALLVL
ncbi:MAG: ABC transporter, partial [Myxococcota bacterium]